MNKLVKIIADITIGYLFLLSVFGTSMVAQSSDRLPQNYHLPDHIWIHILVIVIILLLLHFLKAVIFRWDASTVRRVTFIAAVIYFVFGLALIFATRLHPTIDAASIMRTAQQVLQGDVSAFHRGGYLEYFPFQRGMMLLDIAGILLFGDNAYIALQILNLIALISILVCMTYIVERVWGDPIISVLTVLLQLLFLPLFLYITYNYGTMLGIAFSMLAICLAYHAYQDDKYWFYVPAVLSMALAVELKSNSLIWMIGLIMALVFSAIRVRQQNRHKCYLGIAVAIALLISIKLASTLTGFVTEEITGVQLSRGVPKTCWVFMGLQDNSNAPGAWNGNSTALYEEYDYDYDASNKEAIQRIISLFGYMAHNPSKTVNQFARKISYEWNNPTYEALYIQQGRESAIEGFYDDSLVQDFYCGNIYRTLVQYMNLYQSVILGFCLAGVWILWRRSPSWWEMLPLTIYVGGFVFHLVWEAHPQYTIPYFVLLIPYAAYGMRYLMDDIHQYITRMTVRIGVGTVAVLALLYCTPIYAQVIELRSSEERMADYEDISSHMYWLNMEI